MPERNRPTAGVSDTVVLRAGSPHKQLCADAKRPGEASAAAGVRQGGTAAHAECVPGRGPPEATAVDKTAGRTGEVLILGITSTMERKTTQIMQVRTEQSIF